jgi:threonine dehydrogenase-like Zn-dependent dehydrogenase
MKAVVVLKAGRSWELACVDDAPMPVPEDYECLVRVKACGLCSSTDLKIIHGEHPENPGHPILYPAILGHEGVGEIVESGRKVRYLKLGDRVANPSLGRNYPGTPYHTAYGGMSEYALAADYRAMKEDGVKAPFMDFFTEEKDYMTRVFPKEFSFIDGAMILTFKEVYSALRNFGVKEGMDIAIFGDGPNCMGLSLFLKAYKPGFAAVIGHHDERLEKIGRMSNPGALINSHKQNVKEILGDRKFDIVIDAVGSVDIVKEAADMLKPGGKVCVFGVLNQGKSLLDLYSIPNYTAVQILSYPYKEHRVHDEIVEFMKTGFVKASDFYSHVLPVEEAAQGVKMLEQREAFKVILTF